MRLSPAQRSPGGLGDLRGGPGSYRHLSSGTYQALVAALSCSPGTESLDLPPGSSEESELLELALAEGLAAPISDKLGRLASPAAKERLRAQVRQETVRHLVYTQLLAKFGEVLGRAAVDWVVLKGPVLAELCYRPLARSYADIDLLVPPRQFHTAVGALQAMGAGFASEDWSFLIRTAKGEMSLALSDMRLIDLHWHLVYLRSARERFRIPTDELIERRRHVRIGDVDVWTLDPTDFVAHVALHASLAGTQRLRRLLDIERTVARHPPDWDLLVQRCREWQVELPVATMLQSAKDILGAAVPDGVLRALAGSRIHRLAVGQLSGWVPSGRLPGGRSIKTGLTRCLRDNLRATGAEFLGEVASAVGDAFPAALSLRRAWGHVLRGAPAGSYSLDRYLAMVRSADHYGHL